MRSWEGEPTPDGDETLELAFGDPADPPQPFEGSTARVLELLLGYLHDGTFQIG